MLRETPLTTKNNNNIIANNDTPLPEVAAMVHDQEWFVDDPATKLPVNGNYHSHNWAVKTRMGYMLGRGGDHQNSYSCLEYFMMLVPPEQLQQILQLTNNELAMARKNYTKAGEIVKFFGVMLLVTWFEFGSWASLWSNVTTNKYIAQNFFHQMRFVSTSSCPSGMGKAAIGSTMSCQCMLQSTGNQKMAVRSRMLPVGILE